MNNSRMLRSSVEYYVIVTETEWRKKSASLWLKRISKDFYYNSENKTKCSGIEETIDLVEGLN